MPDPKKKVLPWVNEEYSDVAKKYSEYGGYPEWGPAAQTPAGPGLLGKNTKAREPQSEGETFFKNWYDAPDTRDKLSRQLGLNDQQIDQAINRAFEAEQTHGDLGGDAGLYEQGPHRITTPEGVRGRGALPHELSHASGLDEPLGELLQRQIGKPSGVGPLTDYLNNPGELYGNFTDIRNLLELDPGDWVTPELIESRLETLGVDENHPRRFEIDQLLEVYSLEQIAEGLDKIASVEHDTERLERLNFTPADTVISRPSSLYT